MSIRPVKRLVRAAPTLEGAGVHLRRAWSGRMIEAAPAAEYRFATAADGSPAGQNEVVALQEFLTLSPWDHQEVQRQVQAVFADFFKNSFCNLCLTYCSYFCNLPRFQIQKLSDFPVSHAGTHFSLHFRAKKRFHNLNT